MRGTGVWRATDLTLDYNQKGSIFHPVYILCFSLTLCLDKGLGGYNNFVKAIVLTVFMTKSEHFKFQSFLFLVLPFLLMFSTTFHLYEPFVSVKMICTLSSDISCIVSPQNSCIVVITSNIVERWPYLEIEWLQMQLINIRSYWSGVGLQSNMISVCIKRRNFDTDLHTQNTMWR